MCLYVYVSPKSCSWNAQCFNSYFWFEGIMIFIWIQMIWVSGQCMLDIFYHSIHWPNPQVTRIYSRFAFKSNDKDYILKVSRVDIVFAMRMTGEENVNVNNKKWMAYWETMFYYEVSELTRVAFCASCNFDIKHY